MAIQFANVDTSGWTVQTDGTRNSESKYATLPGTSPTYTPVVNMNFIGTNGNPITEFASIEASSMTYSNTVTGPFSESTVAQCTIPAYAGGAGTRLFGGNISNTLSLAGTDGDELWIRIYHYFPSAFCAGYSTGGDGWGATKWIRWEFNDATPVGARITHEIGGFANASCASSAVAPNTWGTIVEGVVGSETLPIATPAIIPRDSWVALQFHVKFSNTPANSFVRCWVDETYVGEETGIATKPAGSNVIDLLVYGNYWNGGSHQANTWYIGDVIVTAEEPNTKDSGGRSYIHPDTKKADF